MSRPDYAGLRHWALSRETGARIAVYDAEVQGMDPDAGKYAVVCETHSQVMNVSTLKGAREFAAYPSNFCEACQDIARDEAPRVKRSEADPT